MACFRFRCCLSSEVKKGKGGKRRERPAAPASPAPASFPSTGARSNLSFSTASSAVGTSKSSGSVSVGLVGAEHPGAVRGEGRQQPPRVQVPGAPGRHQRLQPVAEARRGRLRERLQGRHPAAGRARGRHAGRHQEAQSQRPSGAHLCFLGSSCRLVLVHHEFIST